MNAVNSNYSGLLIFLYYVYNITIILDPFQIVNVRFLNIKINPTFKYL